MLELDFQHVHPRPFSGLVVRERGVGERPGMPLSPEPVHESIHKLNDRISVKFRCKEADQFSEGLLKKGIIKPRLIVSVRIVFPF